MTTYLAAKVLNETKDLFVENENMFYAEKKVESSKWVYGFMFCPICRVTKLSKNFHNSVYVNGM